MDAVFSEYPPGGHVMHSWLLLVENVPAEHALQLVAPDFDLYPGGHGLQTGAPASENPPALQSMHVLAPPMLYEPA